MPKIWFDHFDFDFVKQHSAGTLVELLGIEFVRCDDECVTARMPIDNRTRQPAGVLHGGASVALAETVATWAATFTVDRSKYHCVGMEINANHVPPVSDGFAYATARPVHMGRTTQVWDIRIVNDDDRLVCISRMTAAVLEKPSGY